MSASKHWTQNAFKILITLALVYMVISYFLLPLVWRHYEHYPLMQTAPKTTFTSEGIPGDPLNIALIGTKSELVLALLKAGWYPADPITFRNGLDIAESVLLGRPYPDAPVSNLFLWGRPQDLAFEKSINEIPKKRHHVRFWESSELGQNERPLWIGAATFDRSVGMSRRTGQITHHIAPNVDNERDFLIEDLQNAGELTESFQVSGIGPTLHSRNGGGDWYFTDGELTIGVLSPSANVHKKDSIKSESFD